jgi:hypothetical protein
MGHHASFGSVCSSVHPIQNGLHPRLKVSRNRRKSNTSIHICIWQSQEPYRDDENRRAPPDASQWEPVRLCLRSPGRTRTSDQERNMPCHLVDRGRHQLLTRQLSEQREMELHPSRSPICSLARVAFLQSLSRAMRRGLEGHQAERCHCTERAVGHHSLAFASLSMKLGFRA